MCYACEFFDVEDAAARVADGLAEDEFGIGPEGFLDFLLAVLLVYKGAVDAEFFQCDAEQVIGAAVDFVRCDDVVACVADVEDCVEIGRLAA
jgi:hypothetical protein